MIIDDLQSTVVPPATLSIIRVDFAYDFWTRIWPKIKDIEVRPSFWIFKVKLKIEKLKFVFEMVFGEYSV